MSIYRRYTALLLVGWYSIHIADSAQQSDYKEYYNRKLFHLMAPQFFTCLHRIPENYNWISATLGNLNHLIESFSI